MSGAGLPDLPPAPAASSEAVRERMRLQPRNHTSCEMVIRSALHRRGLRFRVNCRPLASYRRHADIVFPRMRLAVFVDGCFWHGCPYHGSTPRKNSRWWTLKILRNRMRDRDTTRFLQRHGWTVVRVWEHAAVDDAVERVLAAIAARDPASARKSLRNHR